MSTGIKYIKHSNINKEKWDKCIVTSRNRIVYALSWYLDRLSPNWDALIEKDYESVMPIIHGKKYYLNYIYNPFFSARLGVFSKKELNNALLSDFFDKIPSKYRLISIKVNSYQHLNIENFNSETCVNYELELNKSYEGLFKSFSKNHKKNIRKSYKTGLFIKKEIDIEGLVHLKKELMFSIKNNKINESHFESLKSLLSFAQNKKNTVTYNAYNTKQELCASAVFLLKFNRAVIYSATNKIGKKFRAGYVLIDCFLKDFAESNIVLDFAGSNIKGIADFNAGFGSSKYTYQNFYRNKLRFPLKYLKK